MERFRVDAIPGSPPYAEVRCMRAMSPSATRHHQVLIVGGGAAGITTANLLRRQRPQLEVAILEPSEDH